MSKSNDQKKIDTIKINYLDKNNGQHQLSQLSTADYAGSRFNVDQYTNIVPNGYKFDGFDGPIPAKFDNKNQTVNIEVVPLQRKKVPNRMLIRFLNSAMNDKEVTQIIASSETSKAFNLHRYLKGKIPQGYVLDKVKGQVPRRFSGTQLINVEVKPVHQTSSKSTKSQKSGLGEIVVKYIKAGTSNQLNSTVIYGSNGSVFNINNYLRSKFIPNGYQVQKIVNNRTHFNGTQTVKVILQTK